MAVISDYSRLCLLILLTYQVDFKSWNLFTLHKFIYIFAHTRIVFIMNTIYYFYWLYSRHTMNIFDSELSISRYIKANLQWRNKMGGKKHNTEKNMSEKKKSLKSYCENCSVYKNSLLKFGVYLVFRECSHHRSLYAVDS